MSDANLEKQDKTSCYFCNELFENEYFKGHLSQCGQVLQKCTEHCGAYVRRKDMEMHLVRCSNEKVALKNGIIPSTRSTNLQEKMSLLEEEVIELRVALDNEAKQRVQLITDINALKNKNKITEEWTLKVGDVLAVLKKCVNEEQESRCIDIKNCKLDLNNLLAEQQQMENWRVEMTMKLNQIESELIHDDNIRGHLEKLFKEKHALTMKFNALASELEQLKILVPENINEKCKEVSIINEKLSTVDMVLEDHHNTLKATINEQSNFINQIRTEFQTTNTNQSQFADKQNKMDYEIKNLSHIVHESEDKGEKLNKNVELYRKQTYHTRQCLKDLEVHLANQNQLAVITNIRGHLIWKIDDYANKLKDAKENDTLLRSPIFCNRQYGYTLRLDVNLNGIGTWRNRNLIACLTVVKGEYDTLLPWPCALKAEITLRDQPDDIYQAKDFSKVITAKRKNDNYEKQQYIFIPHATIESCNYVRDDAIFLEVKVQKLN